VLWKHNPKVQFRAFDTIDNAPKSASGHHHRVSHVSTKREPPLRAHGLPWSCDYIKNMINRRGADGPRDLVVAAPTDRCRRRASTFCWLARSACPRLSCSEQVRHGGRRELLELVELEVRELLKSYSSRRHDSGNQGSALQALKRRRQVGKDT